MAQSPRRIHVSGPVAHPASGTALRLTAEDAAHRFLQIKSKDSTWEDYATFVDFCPEIICGPTGLEATMVLHSYIHSFDSR